MQGKNVAEKAKSITHFFNKMPSEINKQVGFSKRRSPIDEKKFARAVLSACSADEKPSLERICIKLKQQGAYVTKQSVSERFNESAHELFKLMLQKSLTEFKVKNQSVVSLLKPFSDVLLTDSSANELPSHLACDYKGCGGAASAAGLKIQTTFSYLSGQIKELTFTAGSQNDQSFTGHLDNIKEGALYLQDLGYFKKGSFEKIMDQNAYFISRYLHPSALFSETGERIDLCKELRVAETVFERRLLLGKKEKLIIRLVAFRLPDKAAEERIRKLYLSAKKKAGHPARKHLSLPNGPFISPMFKAAC